ncbi:hypothetical protein PanWU01x14_199750 [Parasponia andersonii]|uniref:Uncharacterized protein n=1 Tax=Parasponia andersonii TaxID=3476 RepID=A0A2P5BYC7_PARAD|nr:hypothetical protein PanWU01x14_199750 [Parasponia andersonii]
MPKLEDHDLLVSDLTSKQGEWDKEKVKNILWLVDAKEVLNVPLSFEDCDDIPIWHFEENEECSVKSGYKVIMDRQHFQTGPQYSSLEIFCGIAFDLHKKIPKSDFETWCTLSWMIWGDRNGVIHGQRARNPSCILEDTELWFSKYKKMTLTLVAPTCTISLDPKWDWSAPLGHGDLPTGSRL